MTRNWITLQLTVSFNIIINAFIDIDENQTVRYSEYRRSTITRIFYIYLSLNTFSKLINMYNKRPKMYNILYPYFWFYFYKWLIICFKKTHLAVNNLMVERYIYSDLLIC